MSEINDQESDRVEVEREQRCNGGGDEGDAWGSHDSSSVQNYARMPVERDAIYYNMNHKHRGMAIIFNHEHFDIHNLRPRTGTNADSNNLSRVLKGLGFDVTTVHNLKFEEVKKYLKALVEMDHSDKDCLLIAVLSHGEMGMLYARDTHYKPDTLWDYFTADKCPTLAGKPKLFFIQACQGDKLDGGITLTSRTETDGSSPSYRIPIYADFLIVFSTVPGFYSWRNTTRGSWFMQALCDELRENGTKKDILTLLTFVTKRVAFDYESNTPDMPTMHQQKQVPCTNTMLTRLLVFNKKQ